MQQAAQNREYFNLHVNGIGYLNRIRWVNVQGRGRRSEPFLACSIAALRGASNDVQYTYFDLKVSGQDAIDLVEKLQDQVNQRRKILVSFRIADLYAHPYEREARDQNGHPTGKREQAALIKGRLILINSVKVDGQLVYTRPENEESPQTADENQDGYAADPDGFDAEAMPTAPAVQQAQQRFNRQPPARRPAAVC